MKFVIYAAIALVIAVTLLVVSGQLGLLRGTMPADLGVKDGRLKPPSRTPNSASSQADLYEGPGASYARVAPFAYQGDGATALTRIGAIVLKMPGARIMRSGPDYLYVQFETRWLRFVDDVEFWVAPAGGVIHVRSASRLGRRDFGVNRARVEAIRAAFAARGT
jgi:uncharacterized protein (DUF1499 family)